MLQPGGENAAGPASTAANSSVAATGSYSSYTTGDTGSGYNPAGYDVNSEYNKYWQMYEQYYSSQMQAVMCHVCYCLIFLTSYTMSCTHLVMDLVLAALFSYCISCFPHCVLYAYSRSAFQLFLDLCTLTFLCVFFATT